MRPSARNGSSDGSRTDWRLEAPVTDRSAPPGAGQALRGLLSAARPSRTGWGSGPLTRARQARARLRRRPLHVVLLEHHALTTRFAAPMAFWINERSEVATAAVNDLRGADVVWVFSQDPLPAHARQSLAAAVADLPADVVVLNRPEVYDAYHRDDAFPRLAAAGVSVPRTAFTDEDVGRVEVVYKAQREQPARKQRAPYAGPREGFRAFGFEDGRGPDGLVRRYRAYHLGGRSWAGDVFVSDQWAISSATTAGYEHVYELPDLEREQIGLLARTLGLDFFAVDYLRRHEDGRPVFHDVNVYPTVDTPLGNRQRGERGHWHVWDGPVRLGGLQAARSPMWDEFDRALLDLTGAAAP